MIDLSRLRVFIAIVEAGSFTTAAKRLAMTKSAVSQSVAALERELGGHAGVCCDEPDHRTLVYDHCA